jgi:hypothetical protein
MDTIHKPKMTVLINEAQHGSVKPKIFSGMLVYLYYYINTQG